MVPPTNSSTSYGHCGGRNSIQSHYGLPATATFASVAVPEMDRDIKARNCHWHCGERRNAWHSHSADVIDSSIITEQSARLFGGCCLDYSFFFMVVIYGWCKLSIGPRERLLEREIKIASGGGVGLVIFSFVGGLMNGFFRPPRQVVWDHGRTDARSRKKDITFHT
jgi:hypothetical protein